MGRGMDRAASAAGRAGSTGPGPGPGPGPAARSTVQQVRLLQDLIDISLSNLRGLRTKCAASNDLTQHEIRTLEAKLMGYIYRQRQCKLSVPLNDRTKELNSYPRFNDWLDVVNVRKEVVQRLPEELTLDALLEMNESKVKETMKRCGAREEECSRLNGALGCLRKVTESGGELKDDLLWNLSDARRENSSAQLLEPFCAPIPTWTHGTSHLAKGNSPQLRSVSVSTLPSSESLPLSQGPSACSDNNLLDLFSFPTHGGRITPRTPHSITITPPTTPQSKRKQKFKPPRTPPPPSRKVFQLFPNFPTLTRSKSHESQLGNRIDEVPPIKFDIPHISPQMVRRDIGLSVTHRFSTKSWLSQICHVCQKSMMFGVKCKHCRLKCHNKCTKEAPACRIISFLPLTKIRRTESVPSDINNPVDRPTEPQFGTLPKALTKKDHPSVINHLDSSSNPSSTTSSTPSSPAPFPSSNPPSATPPPNPSPMGQRDGRFNFPAAYYIHHRQQFIFPEIPTPAQGMQPPETAENTNADEQPEPDGVEDHDAEMEEQELNKSEPEDDDDEIDDLPSRRPHWKGMISRKASQTSVYLQEWDIPFEQIELGDPIGQGRWGQVYRGKWHGEVAIRLLETDGNNQDHLKLFKKEVMNYRQTRHENVVLFMGACMHPPHLAIITSFCKGRTLHSFVRDPKISLDINKTRQIAQEIIKGMGYLHAKGIVHKDLKSKNVFYENGKVVITDFGLFGISGVVQEGRYRRENELKLPHDWLCYLAPEIVREMAPGKDEDKLPFSKAADVYAFGTVWYELQARDWPFESQPAEALIWQIGSGEGVKQVLATISLGKEVSEILSACWAFDLGERPSFTLLMDMLEKLPKLNRRLSHPGHFWKSADINSSKVVLRFERFGLGILEPSNQKI
ncbi:kinase suppressor of Ras 1 isoform X3 [Alligator mississippiensis]|uniref:kinase suppressor of Ras 1 isoform X3 n=1 Tax=Alligator mississippiensis TaxID=8496 RepID=UPI000906FBED|nr:kinase suppressor of Ras 1 isoform X3 [Alligator mississippiensis]